MMDEMYLLKGEDILFFPWQTRCGKVGQVKWVTVAEPKVLFCFVAGP